MDVGKGREQERKLFRRIRVVLKIYHHEEHEEKEFVWCARMTKLSATASALLYLLHPCSRSFVSLEAGASRTEFPSWNLGTSAH